MSTIHETIFALEEYKKWRRGDETIPMPKPFEIGVAIGDAVRLLREHVTLQSEFEKVTLLAAQTADRNVELRCRAEKAEAEIITARSALSRIANSDYRGNRSLESQIAFAALEEIK